MLKHTLLEERVRELTCLYKISNLDEHKLSVKELLSRSVEYLPDAMPANKCYAVSIEYDGEMATTPDYTTSPTLLTIEDKTIRGDSVKMNLVCLDGNSDPNADHFSKEYKEFIRSVIQQLSLKIDRIHAEDRFRKKQRLLDKSYQISDIGTWEVDVKTSIIYWSPYIKRLHGVESDYDLPLELAFKLVKEGESRQTMKKAMSDAMQKGTPFDVEAELLTGEGEMVWTRIVGEAEIADGKCVRLYGTLQVIEKRKQAELELEKNQRKLQKLINQSPDVICTIDEDDRFMEVSEASYEIWGYRPHELVGRKYTDYVYKEDLKKSEKAHQEIIEGNEMYNFENRYVHKDGSIIPIVWSARWDSNDNVMYCVARDGTEKIVAEQKLKDRNVFIETAIENLSIGIAVNRIDDGTVQLMNNKFSDIYGWPKEELNDVENFFMKVYPDESYREKIKKMVMEDMESGDIERMNWEGIRITTEDGEERIIHARNIPLYEQNLMISTVVDITDQKLAEQQLKENEMRFKALVQDGSELIAIFDEEGIYKYVSPTSESILGIKADHFIGKNLVEFVHEMDKPKVLRVVKNLPKLKRFQVPTVRFRDVNRDWRWLETTITNMVDEPAVEGYVANSRDVTERIKQEEKLAESLEEKEILLAEIHHRVKNNLAIVSGILQLQAYDEQNEVVIERLYDSIFRIQTMASIHELLYRTDSFSRLIFSDIIEKLILSIDKTLKGSKEIDVEITKGNYELNINQAIPCSLIINEVLTNIYKHAFEGRKMGAITFNTEQKEGLLNITIRDDGIGLPDDFNVKESSSLGMNIIRILSTQLEAEFEFNSSTEGTLFTLSFKKNGVAENPVQR